MGIRRPLKAEKNVKGKGVLRAKAPAPSSLAQPPAVASGSNNTNACPVVPLGFQSGSSSSATMPLAVALGLIICVFVCFVIGSSL